MDSSVLEEIGRWLTKIAGAGITILPLIFLVGLVKSIQQLDNIVGNLVTKGRKASEGVGGNINNRRDINAASGNGVWGGWLGANRRRKFRRQAKAASLESGAKHAREHYVDKYAQDPENERYAKQLAGGVPILEQISNGRYGAPTEAALDRVLARSKFRIEQVEIDEIKAAHATIDLQSERDLLNTIRDSATSNTKRAAALERLVQVGSMPSISEAVKKYGGKGEETTESRALAGALQKDGPGFLKASDIDTIRRGKLGATEKDVQGNLVKNASSLEEIATANIAANVFSPAKMAAASIGELKYASEQAQGNVQAVANLKAAATEALTNSTISGSLKHNRPSIESLRNNGKI